MSSKTIAIDARRLRATTGRYVRELLNNLQKLDRTNRYVVIIHKDDEGHWEPTAKNFELRVVPWDHYTFGEQINLPQYIKGLAPDLIHYTMPQQPTLLKIPHITTVHDLTLVKYANPYRNKFFYAIKQFAFKWVLKRAITSAEVILTDALFTKKEIEQYAQIDSEKVVVAYPASDAMPQKTKVYEPAEGKEFIMYVGNAFTYKNLDALMKSHQKLLKDQPELHLFIVGKVDENVTALQETASTNDYQNIHFTGFVDDDELAWMYKNAQAYVFPSLSEGFGMPGLEAMQYNLPVVSSNATCLPEIYEQAAYYFDPEDIESMTKAISDVLSDEDLRKKLSAEGRKQVRKYSWQKMSQQIHQVYLDTLEDL